MVDAEVRTMPVLPNPRRGAFPTCEAAKVVETVLMDAVL